VGFIYLPELHHRLPFAVTRAGAPPCALDVRIDPSRKRLGSSSPLIDILPTSGWCRLFGTVNGHTNHLPSVRPASINTPIG
jgi:hypothetical protein